MATPGGGSLRVYDRDLLDQVLGSPKVRAGVAKPPAARVAPSAIRRTIPGTPVPPVAFLPSDRSTDSRSPDRHRRT